MAMIDQSPTMTAIGEQWEVEYSCFFNFPSLSSSTSLPPITHSTRARLRGTWLSSSPSSISASLKLSADFSISDFVLSVSFLGKVHEEHYISKLNFTWPHVSCMSGYPPRGSRVVFVSYKDSMGQIRKFALRFSSVDDIEAFMANLKELMELPKDFGNKNSDKLVSEISSQSDFVPSEEIAYRPLEDWSTAVTAYKSIDQFESSMSSEVPPKPSFPQTTVVNHDVRNTFGGLPPSFMSLMTMSSQAIVEQAQPSPPEQADIKLQLMRYLDNSSFQDIMGKMEEVISGIGGDMSM